MPALVNDITTRIMETALDGLSLRQQIIGHNVANVETPGYQAQAVTFEAALQQAAHSPAGVRLAATNPAHLASPPDLAVGPRVVPRPNGAVRLDGNNVDIELEMTQLAETSLRYQSLTQLVARKLALLKAIAAGR